MNKTKINKQAALSSVRSFTLLSLAAILCLLFALHAFAAPSATPASPQLPVKIYTIKLQGVINPVTAEFLNRAIKKATDEHAEAIVVMLDTPGGLDSSMRDMVKDILGSAVPVLTYVSPSGARAASAGLFITMASSVAAMAPGTNIGAAHPVNLDGGNLGSVMSEKVENDSVAFIKSLATRYSRNGDWAEQAVRKSVSIPADEALKLKVVDIMADNVDDLIRQIDGRKLMTAFGEKTVHTRGAVVEEFEMSARLNLLQVISDPNVAYVLLMIGIIGMFFELSNPGLILPGVVGAMSLVLAFYAFQTLPVNYAGALLILLSILFFIAEIKVVSYGLLSVAGVLSFVLGSIMLIDSQAPFMQISLGLILPTAAAVTGFFMFLVRVAFKTHKGKPSMGASSMIGETAEARTDITPTGGDVFTQGSHWSAYSDENISKGEKVVVIKVEGLTLKVGRK